MVEVSLTVGKLDASLALLLTKDHHLIEFPTILLPNGVKAGSIVKLKCDEDVESEEAEAKQFQKIQDEILQSFGKNLPESPVLKIKNVTQTLCVLEWEPLKLGTASLKNLVLFKDNKKLGVIPQPLTSLTTKLSGLPINETFKFQLKLDTTAGIYSSDVINVTTHTMTDLSGITVCLGDFGKNEQFSAEDIIATLKSMGAHHPPQDKVKVDTTHFICTRENKQNPEYLNASEMNIPIVRPEWLKACEMERRVVGVRDFYVKDCVLPDILAKNYWGKTGSKKEHDLPELPREEENKNVAEGDEPKEGPPEVKIAGENASSEEKDETAHEDTQKEEPSQDIIPVVVVDSPPAETLKKDSAPAVEEPNVETESIPVVPKAEIETNGDLAGSIEALIMPEESSEEKNEGNAEAAAEVKAGKVDEIVEDKAKKADPVSEDIEPTETPEAVEGDLAVKEEKIEPNLNIDKEGEAKADEPVKEEKAVEEKAVEEKAVEEKVKEEKVKEEKVKEEKVEEEKVEDEKLEEKASEERKSEEQTGDDAEFEDEEEEKETGEEKKDTPVASKSSKKKKRKGKK